MQGQRTGSNPVRFSRAIDPSLLLRTQRMGFELRITDQILSWDIDKVTITDVGNAPAWTEPDGSGITINASMMPGLKTRENIAVWLGTNAHELWHNKYTPRANSLLMRRIAAAQKSTEPGIFRTWNVLEDQRIERLGLARYSPWRGYLIAALVHHIAVDKDESWLFLAGRTWIGDEARMIARAAFVATNDEASAVLAARLIGAYQLLSDPGEADAEQAWQIVLEFHNAFGSDIPNKGGCGTRPVEDGEPEEVDAGEDANQWPTADAEPEDEDEDEDGEGEGEGEGESDDESDDEGDDGDGEGDDDGADGEGDDGDEADGDEGEGDSESDADGEGEGESEGDESTGESSESDGEPGKGTSAPDGEKSLSEAIKDAVDEALGETEAAEELDRVVDNLAHGQTGGGNLPKTTGEWEDVSPEARMLARDVSDVLAQIKDDCEAAWIRRTDTGRFSVDRWATDPDWDADTVFDSFDPGAMDASSLELVLVLDISGSMQLQTRSLAETTWAIRSAVDRVEGNVTCIGFGHDASLMFERGQRPDGRIFLPMLESSTDAVNALREAHRIVADSGATNRIVLVMTDGAWWNVHPAAQALVAAGNEGAVTCVVGLGREGRATVQPGFAGAQFTAGISDSSELVPIFKTLAETSMRRAAGR